MSVFGNVFVHPNTGSLWEQPRWIIGKGAELITAHQHAVMTVHDYPPFYNGTGAKSLSRITGVPAVQELHHLVGVPRAASFSEWIARTMARMYLRKHIEGFAAVRTVNGSVREYLIARGVPAEKIHIIPSMYLDHAVIDAVKNHNKTHDLTFAARLTDNKGLLPVVEAMSLLSDATLEIVGDGPLKAKAEARIASRGLSSKVRITGWLNTPADVFTAIAQGKLFVMNSLSEGNPRVAIEAMALGVPVLATRVGIMPDVIADGINGAFTDGTPRDIAEKARALLADPARLTAMGTEAAKIVARFEKKTAIKVYADFLKGMAERKG
jgi:glycosyltransferase involved in cell wall biosynthesis